MTMFFICLFINLKETPSPEVLLGRVCPSQASYMPGLSYSGAREANVRVGGLSNGRRDPLSEEMGESNLQTPSRTMKSASSKMSRPSAFTIATAKRLEV